MLVIARIEERELRDRFGAEFEAYCARVPRFVPRWRVHDIKVKSAIFPT